MLLVSGGDVYGGSDAYNKRKCRFIARVMSGLGYDAMALGERDLAFGLDAVVEDDRTFDMKIVCANVFRKIAPGGEGSAAPAGEGAIEKDPVFPAYRVIEKGGIRFGVLSVLSPVAKNAKVASEAGEIEALTYVIRGHVAVLKEVIPLVREQSDFVILLAHMSKQELDSALAVVEGVDMVILGHSAKPQVTTEAVDVRGVPVYMASHQGQYLGRATLTFEPDRRLREASNEIRLLDDSVADDAQVTRLVEEFETENRSYQKELFVKEELSGTGSPKDVYLGVSACRRCHARAFDAYTETGHARAYRTLSAVFMQRDSGCLPCHSTGYGTPGGFTGVRPRGAPVDLVDVQCEACHGPAQDHSRDGRYSAAARESCAKCHTAEQDPEFDYGSAWRKIEH